MLRKYGLENCSNLCYSICYAKKNLSTQKASAFEGAWLHEANEDQSWPKHSQQETK